MWSLEHYRFVESTVSVIVFLATCCIGFSLGSCFVKRRRGFLGSLSIALLIGVAVMTVILTGLAKASLFYPSVVGFGSVLVAWVTWYCAGNCLLRMRPHRFDVVLLAVIVGVVLFTQRIGSEEFMPTRDPGVYSCTGIELARTGSLGWTDPLISVAEVGQNYVFYEDMGDSMKGCPRWQFFPGFYLRDEVAGKIQPQFLHLFEPWIAVCYWFYPSPNSVIVCVGLWAVLFCLIFASVARHLLGRYGAVVAVVALCFNPAFIWYARTPSNELMAMSFLWGSFLLWGSRDVVLRDSRRLRLVLIILLIGMCGKFSLWLYLPAFGFVFGYFTHKKTLSLKAVIVGVFAVQALSLLYAGFCADWYSWGSAYVSALKSGWQLWQVIGLFLVLSVLSVLTGFAVGRLPRWHVRFSKKMVLAGFVCAVVFAVWQQVALEKYLLNPADIDSDKWRNMYPLGQLSAYFGLIFPIAFAGVFLLFSQRRGRMGMLLACSLLLGCTLLLKSGIDAMHPWAVRRWLVLLIPVLCLSLGAFNNLLVNMFRSWTISRRAIPIVVLCLTLLSSIITVPAVLWTRQAEGLCESGARLANSLKGADFVIAHPTDRVAGLSEHLWSVYGIDMRVLQWQPQSWRIASEFFKTMHQQGKRVVYVSDFETFNEEDFPFMRRVPGDIPFRWILLPDGYMRPQTFSTLIEGVYKIWEVDATKIPYGWHFPLTWPHGDVLNLPLSTDFSTTIAESICSGGVLRTDEGEPGKGIWLDDRLQVNLEHFVPSGNDVQKTTGGLCIRFRVSNGERAGKVKLHCGVYLNLGKENAKNYSRLLVENNVENIECKIPYVDLLDGAVLTIESESVSFGKTLPIDSKQGILLEQLDIEKY